MSTSVNPTHMGSLPPQPSPSSSTPETGEGDVWLALDRFYRENGHTIKKCAEWDVEKAAKIDKVDEALLMLDSFTSTVDIVLNGLTALGNVHPVLGALEVAIFAFHSVIRLDLARRDNNRKVLPVKLQMQNMMCAMFQLRNLKHRYVVGESKKQQNVALHNLVKAIADDIMRCGSDLTYYQDRRFIVKLLHAQVYEKRFLDHIQIFSQRRSELQSFISAYNAAGIDYANTMLIDVHRKVDLVETKLDTLVTDILRKLGTAQEKDVLNFISRNGGPDACIEKDDLLKELLLKTGDEFASDRQPQLSSRHDGRMAEIRNALKDDLTQNLDAALTKHLERFDRLLTVQNNNFQTISDWMGEHDNVAKDHGTKLDNLVRASVLILEEGKVMRKAVLSNFKADLKDPELQEIWDHMGVKGSVKGKLFISALRGYLLTDNSVPENHNARRPSMVTTFESDVSSSTNDVYRTLPRLTQDAWVVETIKVSNIQSITEAIDNDYCGYITVHDANRFALSRPNGWSLLQWIAFWAEGWHISLTTYVRKIYSIMREMHQACDSIHPSNRSYVNHYLDYYYFRAIEGILRSIKPLPQDADAVDPRLVELITSITTLQEQRLSENLKEISYSLESKADVLVVIGTGRIETSILPLLYLVLRHHQRIINVSTRHVLHKDEMPVHSRSLQHIFSLFDERMRALEELFRQAPRSPESHFQMHAYGMFYERSKGTSTLPARSVLFNTTDINPSGLNSDSMDVSILRRGLGPTFSVEKSGFEESHPIETGHIPHPIEGIWTGVCVYAVGNRRIAYPGCFQVLIHSVVDYQFSGKGQWYWGSVEIRGTIERHVGTDTDTEPIIDLKFTLKAERAAEEISCKGQYCCETKSIRGKWYFSKHDAIPIDHDEKDDDETQKADLSKSFFYITNGCPDIIRFRTLLDNPYHPLFHAGAWSIARRRWAYAIGITFYRIRERMGSSKLFRAKLGERQRWIELIRSDFFEPPMQLSPANEIAFDLLEWEVLPDNSGLYDSLGNYLYDRAIYWRGDYLCDACDGRVIFTRFICIICINDDFTDQVDLCADCTSSPVQGDKFCHHISHSLIKTTAHLHYHRLPGIISQARSQSEQLKAIFRASENVNRSSKGSKSQSKLTRNRVNKHMEPSRIASLICSSCDKKLSLPCWTCVTCTRSILICCDCERTHNAIKPLEGSSDAHRIGHVLLKIMNSSEVVMGESKDRQLDDIVKYAIDDRLSSFESHITSRLDIMRQEAIEYEHRFKERLDLLVEKMAEARITSKEDRRLYERQIDARFDALEQKVDKMETQFNRLLEVMEGIVER